MNMLLPSCVQAAARQVLPCLLLHTCQLLPKELQYRCSSSSSSSSSSTTTTSNSSSNGAGSSSSSKSLRDELGSGAALGTFSSNSVNGDTARRRDSLLITPGGRFYETVTVQPAAASEGQQHPQRDGSSAGGRGGYHLLLRKYPVKTPGKALLVLPSYSLALAVAAEWERLPNGRPMPHVMPLTSLAATAIDQPRQRHKTLEHLLKYVHTDAACIRYEPGPLEQRQQHTFDPLLQWAAQHLGWHLATSHSIFGTTQPDETVAAVAGYLDGLDSWHLAAAEQLVQASKSVVVAAALLHGRISVSEAVAASRLEEDFQLEDWGMVEAGHDLDMADTHTRIAAPAVFARLLQLP